MNDIMFFLMVLAIFALGDAMYESFKLLRELKNVHARHSKITVFNPHRLLGRQNFDRPI